MTTLFLQDYSNAMSNSTLSIFLKSIYCKFTDQPHINQRILAEAFYELVLRLKDCSYEDVGIKLQDHLCHWLAKQGEEEVADWFSAWWCGPV